MKRESNKIKCYVCGKVIGKRVPTGIYDHGIPRVETKLKDNGVIIPKGFTTYYLCGDCYDKGGDVWKKK